jgi:hypothetical protein
MNYNFHRLRSAMFRWSTAVALLAPSVLAPTFVAAQQAPANSAAEPVKPAAPAATVEPVKQTEPPKPIDKVSEDKPVEVKPTPANKPTPDTTTPTAPSTSKVQPNGVETVAPGPSPIAAPGTLSAPPPVAVTPGGVVAQPIERADRYFLLVFGSQSNPKRPKYTHTWATIVKATPDKNDSEKFDLSSHTISWLPRTLNVRVLALRAECGVNLSLKQTLNTVMGNGECVAMWGPYEIDPVVAPQIYDKFLRQITRLNSGSVLYKAVDPDYGSPATYISNCIHAVTDLDGLARRGNYDEIRNNGFAASQYLAGVLIRSGKVDSGVTHEWVAEALGLNCYRIQRRMIIPCKPAVVAAPQIVVQPTAQPQTVDAE